MSPGVVRCVAGVLVVVLTLSCGSSLEETRPDAPVATPPRSSRVLAPQPAVQSWSDRLDDVDELTIVAIPRAPRKLRVEDVTKEEFKTFMLGALRDIDFRKLKAEMDPPLYKMMEASWWNTRVEQRDIDITRGYLEMCRREVPESCVELSPASPYLTRSQKYRVALEIGMDRFLAGFINELGSEIRAMVDPSTLKYMLIGVMVSYLFLLVNPDPIFTKALAAAATVVVTAMLSARTVCDLAFGFLDMVKQVDAARTFEEVAEAGRRYCQKMGASSARVLVMAMTALLSEGGAVARLLGFPKLPQASAALLAETGGAMSLKPIGQVVGIRVLQGGLYVAMAGAGAKVAGNVATVTRPASGNATAPTPANQVRLPPGVVGYKTFKALKDAIGSSPAGYIWHHIVEQCRADIFGAEAVQNRWNVVLLDEETHMKVSAYYSSKIKEISGDVTIREWLKTQTYEQQREFGLTVLRRFGVKF